MRGTRAVVFYGLQRAAQGGETEPILVVLSVCAVHEPVVVDWVSRHAVSDGFACDIEGAEDLVRMVKVGSRYEPARDRRVSNLEGGVALVAS